MPANAYGVAFVAQWRYSGARSALHRSEMARIVRGVPSGQLNSLNATLIGLQRGVLKKECVLRNLGVIFACMACSHPPKNLESPTMKFNAPSNIGCFLLISLCLYGLSAEAATLSDLYRQVPKPPADAGDALTWQRDGRIINPEFSRITAVLAAERAKNSALNGGEAPQARVSISASTTDSLEVQAASRGYADYLARTEGANASQAVLAKRKRWLQAAFGRKQMGISEKMAACTGACADSEAYQMLTQDRDRELKTEIRAWNALFDDWQKHRYGELIAADSRIAATAGAATTVQSRALLASYQAAMLDEIDLLLSITELCVLRVAAIIKGLDGPEPDGISGATKKTGK